MPRQNYTVTFPDGHQQHFDGPPGMSDADLIQRAQQERKFAGGDIATSWAGGSARHLLEDEPATVSSLLNAGALATGAGAPLVAAVPAVTSGLKRLSQFLATGRASPIGLGEVAADVAEGAAMGYGGQALGAAARAIGRAKPAVMNAGSRAAATVAQKLGLPPVASDVAVPAAKWALRLTNPKVAALDMATSKPVLGAVEGLGEALTPDAVGSAFGNVARGLKPGVAAEAAEPAAAGFRGLEAAARRRAAAEANPGYPAWLDSMGTQATAAQPAPIAGLEATGTGSEAAGHLAGRDYPSWLRRMGNRVATEAEPAAVTGLEATATGAPSAPAGGGPDFEDWLQQMRARMATEADSAVTGLEATATGAPGAAASSSPGPSWDSFTALQRAAGAPEAPATGLAATGTSAPGAAPTSGPTWDAFTRVSRPASQAPAAAAAPAAADEAASLAALRRAGAATERAPAAAASAPPPRGRTAAQFAQFSPEARAARAAAQAPPAGAVGDVAPAAIPEFDVPSGPTIGAAASDAAPGVPPDDAAALEALLQLPMFQALLRKLE